jgi:hypothetical protein
MVLSSMSYYLSPVESVDAKQSIVIDAKEQESLVTLSYKWSYGLETPRKPSSLPLCQRRSSASLAPNTASILTGSHPMSVYFDVIHRSSTFKRAA